VLTSTAPVGPDDWVAHGVDRALYNRIWVEAQADLVALASDVQQRLVDDSDHHLQLRRPDLVLMTIAELVGSRAGDANG
jgi:hypothetical protein